MNDIILIPIEYLHPHPNNPRKDLGDLTELADSIKQVGILQNLTVVPMVDVDPDATIKLGDGHYVVLIGHRRLEASRLAGLKALPCVVTHMTVAEQLSAMLLENMQRSDLTVYEQAWGFQQLTILGYSEQEIADKSGFSKSTVRRRLKMAELDHRTLKEVSTGRQLSLADFDRLAEIEDMTARNKVLASIGTRDFDAEFQKAVKEQKQKKNKPLVAKWLKEHKAKKLKDSETWGGKYEGYNGGYASYIFISEWGEGNNKPPKTTDKQIYYTMDNSSIRFFREKEKQSSSTPKKSREQLDREKLGRNIKKDIRRISELHYQLRKGFIERLTVTRSNREAVLMGAALIGLYYTHGGGAHHSDDVTTALGLDNYEYKTKPILEGIGKLTDSAHDKELAKAIYAMYRDSAENWFADDMLMSGAVPYYNELRSNVVLKLLYNWLISLGYEMSTEEAAMFDGSHELYHKGGK